MSIEQAVLVFSSLSKLAGYLIFQKLGKYTHINLLKIVSLNTQTHLNIASYFYSLYVTLIASEREA